MSSLPNCPCDLFVHPQAISNLPGQDSIRYRIGDYNSFRHALLLALTDDQGNSTEIELANWKPTATSDLALQMVEWWAYLADILTFYNERIANEDYLRTADFDESVKRLIRLLGYRPRPGIGALATLAAITKSVKPFTLPKGFAVQSKPGPGKQPQIFELDADTLVQPRSQVSADPLPEWATLGADSTVLVKGSVASVKAGDKLLVVERNWSGNSNNYAFATVASVTREQDPRGQANTRIKFTAALGLPSTAVAANYQLFRSTQAARLWQYAGVGDAWEDNGSSGVIHLDSVVRQIHPGDMILFDQSTAGSNFRIATLPGQFIVEKFSPLAAQKTQQDFAIDTNIWRNISIGTEPIVKDTPSLQLSSVTGYTEQLWYANGQGGDPTKPPTDPNTPGIAILHSVLTFTPAYSGFTASALLIRHGWQEVGKLVPTPAASFSPSSPQLIGVKPPNFPAGSSPILLEDAVGGGESATGFVGADTTRMQLSKLPQNPSTLAAPVNVLFNLLNMSRGKTVLNEVLGSGNAGISGQEFVLKKAPLTYFLSADSSSGGNYKSTLRVRVNGIEWKEVASFYGQSPNANVFVTREDENGQTHVQFGDGINGTRLPSGANNVVASYRFGSGAEVPEAGKLTTIVTPQPGLASVRNPVIAGGGADPEPAAQIRRYAPLSVLTFGRAVSGEDYEAIAASAPGVARAKAYWSFDPIQQRTVVTVYVGDDDAAVNAAQVALHGDADPNRPAVVKLATAAPVRISFTLVTDPKFVSEDVVTAVQNALLDSNTGLFGASRIGIGEVIYASRIYEACLAAPGAVAVHSLNLHLGAPSAPTFRSGFRGRFRFLTPLIFYRLAIPQVVTRLLLIPKIFHFAPHYRFDPGEGAYFSLDSSDLTITSEVASNAG